MIGSVSPAMHKYIWKPAWWVFTHKVKSVLVESILCMKIKYAENIVMVK